MKKPLFSLLKLLKRTYKFISVHKSTVVVAILIVITILFLVIKSKSTSEKTSIPIPTPLVSSTNPTPAASYFINKLTNTTPPVNGFSWVENRLYYSNNSGIFSASDNTSVINDTLSNISWSNNGKTVYRKNEQWFFMDLPEKKEIPLSLNLTYPKTSPNGDYILDCAGQNVSVYSINTNSIISKKISDSNITFCDWPVNSNMVVVVTPLDNGRLFVTLNEQLNQIHKFERNSHEIFVSISPDGNGIYTNSNDNLLFINKKNKVMSILSDTGSKYSMSWIDNQNAIIVQTNYSKSDRPLDLFWKYNVYGKVEYLANSLPVAGRVNTHVKPQFGPDKSAFIFSENNGHLWILSLLPRRMAFYSEKGITYHEMSSKDQDY